MVRNPALAVVENETKDERRRRLQTVASRAFRVRHPDAGKKAARKWRLKHPSYKNPKAIATTEMVRALKAEPCTDCGGSFPFECMDFDHVGGDAKFNNVGTMVAHNYSDELIFAEIAKCELVCANCHRTRTRLRKLQQKEMSSK